MQVIKGPREALLKPLTIVGGIIENHQTMNILSNVLIKKNGTDVSFTGTDLEILIRTHNSNGVDGGDPVAFTVSARKALDLFKVLPDTEVTLSLGAPKKSIGAEGCNQISRKLEVKTTSSRFALQTLPAEDYPDFPQAEFESKVVIPATQFKYLLSMVHYAMAVQDIRFYLNAMRLIVKNGTMSAVATDGRRLAYCEIKLDGADSSAEMSATIPRKTVSELKRLVPDTDTPVTIEIAPNQARFTFEDVEVITKLVEGKYPDFERVIPTNNDKQFLVNREELLGALHRTAVLASDKFKGVRLLLTPGLLSIQTSNSEQEEGNDDIAVDYQGEPLDIGFNVNFMSDVLSNLKNDKVKISLSGPQSPALITMPDSDSFKYVLMPMRL
ncbi:DNA polymerase III subunit beta [Mesosutterella sp. OilRF-GAM-744-9]|uniref:Beta sliding clamp n=1 Tax=Mesosutterella porci TaxID=2915351 RepID=A0ABS9MRE8_9BURK|nr:DNA polymerase III subunit beta [Mesosutterella sp. oilRF-744-WT-GAM-9]MCG5031210.1 DNA polymerase III subunit beta [Mesosutterella sp. oilRF-744-WT-GAM-9]